MPRDTGRNSDSFSPEPAKPAAAASTTTAIDWRRLHLWQIQPVRDLLVLAAVFFVAYLGYLLRVVTVPILLALLLAYLFEPLIRWMTRRKQVTREGAAIGVIVLAGLVIVVPVTVGLGFAVVQGAAAAAALASTTGNLIKALDAPTPQDRQKIMATLSPSVQDLGEWIIKLREEVHQHREQREGGSTAPLDAVPTAPTSASPPPQPASPPPAAAEGGDPSATNEPSHTFRRVPAWRKHLVNLLDTGLPWVRDNAAAIGKAIGERAVGGGAQALAAIVAAVMGVGMFLFQAFLTAFFFYFFSTGWGRVLRFWESLIPEKKKGRVFDLAEQMDRVIAGFVRGRLTICALLMLYLTIAYWAIGVPAPLLVGPLIGLLFLVPYASGLGVPLAMILMALNSEASPLAQEWWWILLAPSIVYMGGQLLDDYVLSPFIQGKTTDMDTPTILFASIAGGALAGVYGLLLAIPIAACLKILAKETLFPRIKAWAAGKAPDVLPISNQ